MNINARNSERIRSSEAPLDDAFNELEDFADSVGGLAWRQRRARTITFARSVALYLDEDAELLPRSEDPDENKSILDGENDAERIYVGFEASRVISDEPGAVFSNLYEIVFSHSLPLTDLSSIPQPYREQVIDMITQSQAADDETDTNTTLVIDPSEQPKNLEGLTEERITTYTLDQADCTIDYKYKVAYTGNEYYVNGPEYDSSEPIATEINPSEDEYGLDRGPLTLTEVDQISTDTTDELLTQELAYEENMIKLQELPFDGIELIAHSAHTHATRVMALMSILRSGVYVRPVNYKD